MKEAVNHTKIKRLCRRMQIPQWQAVGLLESIWILTEFQAPAGDIGRLSNEDIAVGIEYGGDEDKMIADLVATGWLDSHLEHRLLIHDWPDHCADAIHMKLARKRLYFACGRIPKTTKLSKWERESVDVFYSTKKNPMPNPADPIHGVGEVESVRTNHHSVPTPSAQKGTLSGPPHPTPPHPTPPIGSSGNTHTHADRDKNGTSKVSVCVSSTRFADWWQIWSAVRGTNHRTQAQKAYPRLVTVDLEQSCFECTASYLRSLSDPARGYHPENFLTEQAKDKFEARWPVAARNSPRPAGLSVMQRERTELTMEEQIEAFRYQAANDSDPKVREYSQNWLKEHNAQ
jgi:hypothetical protein